MSESQDLLIEIGTEELPPKALLTLSQAFAQGISQGLTHHELSYGEVTPYATPRRLAVWIKAVAAMQVDQAVERRGPAIQAAYDQAGNPSKAGLGFARSCGVEFAELETLETDKGEWLIHRSVKAGQATPSLLAGLIDTALAGLPIPKRMRWGNSDYAFVRPVHWLVVLFGYTTLEFEIMGVRSGRMTRGHRFHHSAPLEIIEPAKYADTLATKGSVIAAFSERRTQVQQAVFSAAKAVGGTAVIDDDLLDEVTSLVEWPVPITGQFEEKFLDVPPEALIATMQGNQKYFPVVDAQHQLMPYFIAISNIQSKQPELVKAGNERVIRPRFSDAMFFWQQDKARRLESHIDGLKNVLFQQKLGSLYAKSERVAHLASRIAQHLGADEDQARRAAFLSKCDLSTDMVGEFPELQGIMGEYYARHDNEPDAVAIALREQYLPRFSGDVLPQTPLGQALSIADKLDTLVGIFGIGQPPTGDKDPFSLRRAAIGILRIAIEQALPLDLRPLLTVARDNFTELNFDEAIIQHVFEFMLDRLKGYYQERQAHVDSIDAVLACHPSSPLDADRRIRGVEAFRQLEAATSLASANKRIHNILKKAEQAFPSQPNPSHFTDTAEQQLFAKMQTVQAAIAPLVATGDYSAALTELASMRETVDTFFDEVMVMAEDATVRANRLAFLHTIRALFLQVADISRLQAS